MHRLWQRIYDYWDYIYFPGLRRRIAGVAALLVAAIVAAVCLYRPPLPDEVEQAEPLIATHPDSAYALLTRVEQEVQDCSESNRMRFYLLYAEAANKAFMQLPSDSVMRCVADHYDSHGTPNEQMRAHYLLGCTYRDLNNRSKAQEEYFYAIHLADTLSTECNYALLSRVYGQLGELYVFDTAPRMTLEIFRQCGEYALKANDSLMWADAYRKQAFCYTQMEMPDSAIYILMCTQSFLEAWGRKQDAVRLNLSLCVAFLDKKDVSAAAKHMDLYEKYSGLVRKDKTVIPGIGSETYYTCKVKGFLLMKEPDSVLIYTQRMINSDKSGYVRGAYGYMVEAYEMLAKKDSVVKYAKLYSEKVASDYYEKVGLQLQDLQMNFDIDKAYKKAEQKEIEAKRNSLFLRIVFLSVVLLSVIALLVYRKYWKKKTAEVHILRDRYYYLQQQGKQTKERIALLEASDTNKEKMLTELRQQVQVYKKNLATLRAYQGRDAEVDVIGVKDEFVSLGMDIIERLHECAKNNISFGVEHTVWVELFNYIDGKSSNLLQLTINPEIKLNPKEKRVCFLVWAGFTPIEMSVLLSASKQNMSTIRVRLLKKIFGVDGKPEDFDRKIREF